MSAPVNQGNIARLLQEGINAIAQSKYNRWEPIYSKFLEVEDSEKAYEIDQSMAGLGVARLKPEGSEIHMEGEQQLYSTVYRPNIYAIGTIITYEAIMNNLYEKMMEKSGNLIETSLQEVEERKAADVINNGYDSGVTGGDGQPLFSASHSLKSGTFSNKLNVFAELSEASLEDACIAVSRYTDPAGNRVNLKTKGLLIPVDLEFEAARILRSTLQNDTANNATNALRELGKFPDGMIASPYFSDTGAWTVTTDCPDGGKFIRRQGHMFRSDNSDTNTLNYRHAGITWFATGWTDPRKYFGSGASA